MKRHIYNIITLSLILALYSCGEQSNTSDQIEAESTAAMDNRIQVTQAQLEHSNMIFRNLRRKIISEHCFCQWDD